jgi:CheY-like chemotaxis protein
MRLELLGNFEVLTAKDGEKGYEVAAAEQPDIILMDLEMPVVDGWEATRRLKGNSQTQAHSHHRLVCTRAGGRAREGYCHGMRGVRHQTD